MSKARFPAYAFSIAVVVGIAVPSNVRVLGAPVEPGEALTVRLVHPERQAARVLSLFEGARSPHPAAALAAWKRATRDRGQLGKPLEAVISFFNPEMIPEWRVMDGAQIGVDLSDLDGKPRWFGVVPRDDGTLSAAITAQRLTNGSQEAPLTVDGRGFLVERLGAAGSIVAAQAGETLILASSRDELIRGSRRIGTIRTSAAAHEPEADGPAAFAQRGVQHPFDSGLVFDLEPGLMSPDTGTIAYRRAAALLQGLGCQRIHGDSGLTGDLFTMELTTMRKRGDGAQRLVTKPLIAVDPTWLEWIPAADVMAALSVAVEPGEPFWESTFAVADRVDRADPARAALAPLRARLNLLAAAAGVRPEADMWPHLRGITAGVMGDPDRPGRPIGAVVVLHTDTDASAQRLETDVLPRLSSLLTAQKRGEEEPGREAGPRPAGDARLVARIGGRPLMLSRRGPHVVIAWGDEMKKALQTETTRPDRSVASLCNGWIGAGKMAPQRVGAVWPARCWPAYSGLDPTTPAWRELAAGPPAVWWGWHDSATAHDSIQLGDLRHRVRRFLEKLPLDPSPLK